MTPEPRETPPRAAVPAEADAPPASNKVRAPGGYRPATPKSLPPAADGVVHIDRRGNRCVDWTKLDSDYIAGTEIDGTLVFPGLAELATKYGIAQRQIARRSGRHGWVEKRDAWKRQHAIEAHTRRIGRLIRETELVDAASLTASRALMAEILNCLKVLEELRRKDPTRTPSGTLDTLSRALERAQKVARMALHMPTELLEQAETAETKRAELQGKAEGNLDTATKQLVDKLAGLEGPAFLEAIDRIFAVPGPGAGMILDVKALPPKPAAETSEGHA